MTAIDCQVPYDRLTTEDKRELKRRVGRCEICTTQRSLVVDHCHDTGYVRGILCSRCNIMLGQNLERRSPKWNREWVIKASAYLAIAPEAILAELEPLWQKMREEDVRKQAVREERRRLAEIEAERAKRQADFAERFGIEPESHEYFQAKMTCLFAQRSREVITETLVLVGQSEHTQSIFGFIAACPCASHSAGGVRGDAMRLS